MLCLYRPGLLHLTVQNNKYALINLKYRSLRRAVLCFLATCVIASRYPLSNLTSESRAICV